MTFHDRERRAMMESMAGRSRRLKQIRRDAVYAFGEFLVRIGTRLQERPAA